MSQQDINLKIYRGRLKRAHERFPEKITLEMLKEFELDVASDDPTRKTLAEGRAQRWLTDLQDESSKNT